MNSSASTISQLPQRTWLASAIVALLAASSLTVAPQAQARFFLSVNIAPPMLPVYEQPAMPGAGYLFTPGYWAYADAGYYWVPGTWVRAPYSGALWTPGYWGYNNNAYIFNQGYWGLHVGYYGGINYGFGYGGNGYYGGYWGHGGFYYNRAYNQFGGVRITNVYNRTEINTGGTNRYSFNGPGGADRRATSQELAYSHERHSGPVRDQLQQREFASHNESLRASVNHGTPPVMATARAGAFEHGNARSGGMGESGHAQGHPGRDVRADQNGARGEHAASGADHSHRSERAQQVANEHAPERAAHEAHVAAVHSRPNGQPVAHYHSAQGQQQAHVASQSAHANAQEHQQAQQHPVEHQQPHQAPMAHAQRAPQHASAPRGGQPHAAQSHGGQPHGGGQPHASGGGKPKGNGHD